MSMIRVAGAMSGTSLDGVDVAVIETDGIIIHGFGETRYRAYSHAERATLRAALGRWPGAAGVAAATAVVETAHIEAMAELAAQAIGFHGQTLAHDPNNARTHQAGNGPRLAAALGVPVVWDFRSADMAQGGQGAPFAPFYHWALARYVGVTDPIAVLNLGGVGNLTWVDPRAPTPDAPGALLAFDTGPANGPLDDFMTQRGLGTFDAGGRLTHSGHPDHDRVAAFLQADFFKVTPPKSLDRLDFEWLEQAVSHLSDTDALATLAACSVAAVARGMDHVPTPPASVWVTGGGRKNAGVMAGLAHTLPMPVIAVEDVGLNGDFLEAQAFAYLAARVLAGLSTSAPGTTGVRTPTGGAQIAHPPSFT